MKKLLTLFSILALLTGLFAGCSAPQNATPPPSQEGEPPRIVCTTFPQYDWVRQILGDEADRAELTMLLNTGVDLHSYQPTADDLVNISTCDLFVYVGGESDGWVTDALRNATNPDMVVVNLIDVLGDSVKQEAHVEGMQPSEHSHEDEEHAHEDEHHEDEPHNEDHNHDHEGEHHEDEHDHTQDEEHTGHNHADEHVWLSLKNAQVLCRYLADTLSELDRANADSYQANASAYLAELDELDRAYHAAVEQASLHTILFGDRFPFRYLADDYGLTYYAAFSGCSAETKASFETIAFLSAKVDELGLPSVLTIEGTQHKIAQTVVENTAQKSQTVLILDSMQSVTAQHVADGANYLAIMAHNLDVLKLALQ